MERIEEIERRLRAATGGKWEHATDLGQVGSIEANGMCILQAQALPNDHKRYVRNANTDFVAHCGGDDGDVAFLLGEVRRLMDERDRANEAQSLALSLADALAWYVENDDTNMMQEGNEFWIDGHNRGRSALSDERLTKLREMKNE